MSSHQIQQQNEGYTCTVCGGVWKSIPTSKCPGVQVYRWGQWPDHLLTKQQLNNAGYTTGKKLPPRAGAVYRRDSPGGIMWLYDVHQATPKRQATPAQLAALDKARRAAEKVVAECKRCGRPILELTRAAYEQGGWDDALCHICHARQDAQRWARETMNAGGFVVLDTETTDLDGEIIEIAVIDERGAVLLDTLVRAAAPIHPDAQRVHGISRDDLLGAPYWPAVYLKLRDVIAGRRVLIYNWDFDAGRIHTMNAAYKLPRIELTGSCLMHKYAAYFGEWSDYWRNFKFQPLGGNHAALGDCRAALALLRSMAQQA